MIKRVSDLHVGLISYQVGHRKTWDLAHRYRLKGYRVTIYGFPFSVRPQINSPFNDRPEQIFSIDVAETAKKFGFKYVRVDSWSDENASCIGYGENSPQVYITCIGKIIPAAFLANRVIINAHPGLLPQNRGVDAFKWSIINKWPIGVTLHIIDEKIDCGLIIKRERTPIYSTDDFKIIAARNYELECNLLADFNLWLDNAKNQNWKVDAKKYPLSKNCISDTQNNNINYLFRDNLENFISHSTNFLIHAHESDELHNQ
jgi:hypothetical protein